jgi:hypothetical protein
MYSAAFPMEALEGQFYLTDGDLPHNILVDGSKITAVLDWETTGYYGMDDVCMPVGTCPCPRSASKEGDKGCISIFRDLHHKNPYVG